MLKGTETVAVSMSSIKDVELCGTCINSIA